MDKLICDKAEFEVGEPLQDTDGLDTGLYAIKTNQGWELAYFCEGVARGDSISFVYLPGKNPDKGCMVAYERFTRGADGYAPPEISDGMGLVYDSELGPTILEISPVTGPVDELVKKMDGLLEDMADYDRANNDPHDETREDLEEEGPEV